MDKQQARFILRSFRPDGSDGSDPQFAEALLLAHGDVELGLWLASERSFDAAFAAALAEVELPACLCHNILTGLAIERGDVPQAADAMDAAWIGALASIEAPAALRGEVLAAMTSTTHTTSIASSSLQRPWWWRRAAIPLAAAAGIALAFAVTHRGVEQPFVQAAPLPADVVETGFIRTFESPLFSLDEKRDDHTLLVAHLEQHKLPCPCCLPRGLTKIKGIGCRELTINGKIGSLICYDDQDNGVVHLVIFRRQDVCGDFPDREAPALTQHGRWTVACWAHNEKVFMLLGNSTNVDKLAELF
ncbi:MAG: hypothetical protein WCK77_00850 [Verrucomicrobiota bacterium]